jgi:hypothetical protein
LLARDRTLEQFDALLEGRDSYSYTDASLA